MNEIAQKTPVHLWIVGVVSLLWNLGGIISYAMTKLRMLDARGMPGALHSCFYGFPAWATVFWALSVWGALAGSAGLLFRRKWAAPAFAIALIGLLGTTYYERFFADMPAELQTTGQQIFAVAIWVITTALFFYARAMRSKGVLR